MMSNKPTDEKLEKVKRKYNRMNKKKKASYFGSMIDPKGFHPSQIKFYVIILPIMVIMILPIMYIVFTAFKPISELYDYPPKFITFNPTTQNFISLLEATSQTGISLGRYVFNSLIVTVIVIISSLLMSSLAAFAFSFIDFKGKKFLFMANQFAIMFIAIAVAVPRFIVISKLGITNTYFAHIIPLLAMPVGVFLLKQFIDQIPRELNEAAVMDGANRWQIYLRIILPNIKPALATVAILTFQQVWNNTETSTLYVVDEALKTLPYYLGSLSFGTSSIASQGISAASSLIMFLPNIIIFIVLQKQVMNTMAHSGIK